MSEATQNLEPPATGAEQGSEEAAIAALSQLGKSTETENQEPLSKPEPGTDEEKPDEDEVSEDTKDEEESKPALVEVEYEGKQYSVPEEIKGALLRQSDYSRKMNEIGTTEKTLKQRTEQAEMYVQGAVDFADALAEVKEFDRQIARFEKVNWAEVRANNPSEYAALYADIQNLKSGKAEALDKVRQIDANLKKTRETSFSERRNVMVGELQKNLKGWGDELGTKITRYAVENGYTLEDVSQVTDSRWVVLADKARRYDEIQKSKAGLKEKVQNVPQITKPGAPRNPDKSSEAMARFRKSTSTEDAIALLEARVKR